MVRAFGLTDSEHLFCCWSWVVIKDLIDHVGMYVFGSNELSWWDDPVSFFLSCPRLVGWFVPQTIAILKRQLVRAHVDLNRISLISVDWKFEFSVFILHTPCTHTPSLPSGSWMPRGVCPLCSIFIPVLLCVPASKGCLCLPIHIGLVSCLSCVSKHFFRTVILVDDLDLSAPVLMRLWFCRWSSALHRSSAVIDHQIPARWPCFYINFIFK